MLPGRLGSSVSHSAIFRFCKVSTPNPASIHPLFSISSSNPLNSYYNSHPFQIRPSERKKNTQSRNRFYTSGLSVFQKPERNPNFKVVNDADIAEFEKIVGTANVLRAPEDLLGLNEDWMGKYKGNSKVALRPKSTEEVSKLLRYCSDNNIAVVPQGGNTGLVGGSVPVHDEVILNMSRMVCIREFDKASGVIVVEAGAVLQSVDDYLQEREHVFPLDLGAKGSCQIGGNVATNAGGIRFLRYGSLHGNVLGVEAVLADGQVLNTLATLRKDNTGYDLKQLFIGSEGTLGIITAVSVLCPPRPKAVHVAFLAVPSFENCIKILSLAKQQLGEILSAFEFMDNLALSTVLKIHPDRARNPFAPSPLPSTHFFVLIETHGSNQSHDHIKIDSFLETLLGAELIEEGALARNDTNIRDIWFLRESIPESISKAGKVYKYDISIPLSQMYDIVTEVKEKLAHRPTVQVAGYGHMGDSNLHLNVFEPSYTSDTLDIIEPFVYEWTSKVGGSISAEHGIGVMKPGHLHYSKSTLAIDIMKGMKQTMDPKGILNPYKVFPQLLANTENATGSTL